MDTAIVVITLIVLILLQNLIRYWSAPLPQLSVAPPKDDSATTRAPRPVRLTQINPLINEDTEIDLDIIAIHGLDTRSPHTWTYRSKTGKPDVNWLQDSNMLPSIVGKARIFTCDWPSETFESSSFVQKSLDDFALGLLAGIQSRHAPKSCSRNEGPAILFVASCIGGVVLMKALVEAQVKAQYSSMLKATRGIVFLATPFRGIAFDDFRFWAEPGLHLLASYRSQTLCRLLDELKSHSGLPKLVGDFTQLYHKNGPFMAVFFETKKTILPYKLGLFRLTVFKKEQLASLQVNGNIVPHSNMFPAGLRKLCYARYCGQSTASEPIPFHDE